MSLYKGTRNVLASELSYPSSYYSPKLVAELSVQITRQLTGVHPKGKNIIVPNTTILSVLDSVYMSFPRDTYKNNAAKASGIIIETIKQEFGAEKVYNSLSIDAIKYSGDVRRHQKSKINEKIQSKNSVQSG